MALSEPPISQTNHSPDAQPNRNQLGVVARGAGLAFVGQIAFLGLGFLFQFLLARLMGAEIVGIFAWALSLVTIFSSLATLGLLSGMMRSVARLNGLGKFSEAAGSLIASTFLVFIASSLVSLGLYFSAGWIADVLYKDSVVESVLKILSFSIPFLSVGGLWLVFPQALKKIVYSIAFEQVVQPALKIVGLLLVFWLLGSSVIGLSWMFVGVTLVIFFGAGIVVTVLYRTQYLAIQPMFPIKALLLFSWPLMFMDVLTRAMKETQTIILGIFTTGDQVGIYFVALRIVALLSFSLTAFSLIFSPIMAEMHGQGKINELGSLYKVVTRWGLSMALPIFLVLFILSEETLAFFGQEFISGVFALRILLIAQLISVAAGASGKMLIMTGYPKWNLVNSILILAFSITFSVLMVPVWGISGAAVGWLGSMFLINVIRLLQIQYFVGINPLTKESAKPIFAAAVSGIIGYLTYLFLDNSLLILQVIACAMLTVLVFFGVLLASGLNESDLFVLQKIPVISKILAHKGF